MSRTFCICLIFGLLVLEANAFPWLPPCPYRCPRRYIAPMCRRETFGTFNGRICRACPRDVCGFNDFWARLLFFNMFFGGDDNLFDSWW